MNTLVGDSTTGSPDPVAIAAQLIASLEGFSPTAYPDPPGQTKLYSLGYGHQIRSGDGFDTSSQISQSDALALLQTDLSGAVNCVNNAVSVDLDPQQLAALYSFTYNVGPGHFLSSTLLKCINASDFSGAQAQFAVWNIANGQVNAGLVARRQQEADLFGSGDADGTDGTQVA
jgi:lysozyme